MIELAALLRLVPYVLVLYLAVVKRFPYLGVFAAYLMVVALINFVFTPPNDVRAVFSSFGAFLLLLHTLDLRSRRS